MDIGRKYKVLRFFFPKYYLYLQAKRPYHQDLFFYYIPKLVSKESISIDVGTNKGIYSYWLSKSSLKVYSFEPNTELVKELKRTLPANCKLLNFGLSSASGQLVLNIPLDDGLASFETENVNISKARKELKKILVDIKRLDDFNFKNII